MSSSRPAEAPPSSGKQSRRAVLITGGAGFVDANLAHRLLSAGERVVIYDNLSRAGVEENYRWLHSIHGDAVTLQRADLRDGEKLRAAVREASSIFHLAAQVAVTTSLEDPQLDFSTNVVGTMNVLEALRSLENPPPLVFTSTNKVYGSLPGVPLERRGTRYEPRNAVQRQRGIDENQGLEFYSPYGCSKGAADQYVLDYARSFGLPAVVFRMSCIYGPHQFGTEGQGWVAHFLIQAREKRPITVYGDGRQVRDILFVDDLVDALLLARENANELAGEAFNIGGGPENTTSLLELIELIAQFEEEWPQVITEEWRIGDQRYYVSDTGKFECGTGWRPKTAVADGVRRLHEWLRNAPAAASTLVAETR